MNKEKIGSKELRNLENEGWIKMPCLETDQGETIIYTVSMSGRFLAEHSKVLARGELPKEGIQRIKSPTRCNRIAKFIARDGAILANNHVGNISSDEFHYNDRYAYFHPGFLIEIIDGQHRIGAFESDKILNGKDMPLIISFVVDAPAKQRAALFYRINKEQKTVNPSLAYDLLELMGEKDEKAQLAGVAKLLDSDKSSPFFGLIKKNDGDTGRISLVTVVDYLNKFLKQPVGRSFIEDGIIREEKLFLLIKNYFNAIKAIFPEEWSDESHWLVKSLGFGAWMSILPDVWNEHFRVNDRSLPTANQIQDLLEPLEGYRLDPALGGMSSVKGQQQIGQIFLEELGWADVF